MKGNVKKSIINGQVYSEVFLEEVPEEMYKAIIAKARRMGAKDRTFAFQRSESKNVTGGSFYVRDGSPDICFDHDLRRPNSRTIHFHDFFLQLREWIEQKYSICIPEAEVAVQIEGGS